METSPLTREDWLNQALTQLQAGGHDALKAQPLAKSLNVTRGSFYHHFESLRDFHTALIDHWSKVSSGQIILAAQASADPRAGLDDLLQKTFRSGQALERAIRAWSTVEPLVAGAVATVDQDRIRVAEGLLVRGGVAPVKAGPRARLLYWAAIGRLMMPYPAESVLSAAEISDLVTLMLEPGVGKG
jgi:AcrR family transcriptional regulator